MRLPVSRRRFPMGRALFTQAFRFPEEPIGEEQIIHGARDLDLSGIGITRDAQFDEGHS